MSPVVLVANTASRTRRRFGSTGRSRTRGGLAFVGTVGKSLPGMKVMAAPHDRKDVSECHLHAGPVLRPMEDLRAAARDFRGIQADEKATAIADARQRAGTLLRERHILDRFIEVCRQQGLVGEERTVKLLYLALISRLLAKPVSVVAKGPSSGGKAFTVDMTLRAFPESAYYALSSMSEKSLAYSEGPLEHRVLVLYEAAGLTSDFATYLVRTLLSEVCVRYETVEKTSVKAEVREAVEAVAVLSAGDARAVDFKRVGEYLGLDKSAARRCCELALDLGYLVNPQNKRGQPAILL